MGSHTDSTTSTDLQNDPDVDDQVAAHENRRLPRDGAVLVDQGQPVDPGLAGCNAEHGDEGQVELGEAGRDEVLEERHPEDGVWARGRRRVRERGRAR